MSEPGSGRFPPPPSRELLAELWHDPKARSRNRNFYRFRCDPAYYRAARHIRSLRALRADLIRFRSWARISVEPVEGAPEHFRVSLEVPRLRLRRAVYVTEFELELLGQEPALDDLVAIPKASPDRRG